MNAIPAAPAPAPAAAAALPLVPVPNPLPVTATGRIVYTALSLTQLTAIYMAILPPPNPNTVRMVDLRGRVAIRHLVLNAGINPNSLSSRVCEAITAFITGVPAPQPCWHCANGHGPFPSCIIVPGVRPNGQPWLMDARCAGCHYGRHGCNCSFVSGPPPLGATHKTRRGVWVT